MVARTQRVLEGAERSPVARIPLCADEIEELPPLLRTAARQLDVLIAKPHDAPELEPLLAVRLLHAIERQLLALRAVVKLEMPLRKISIHHKAPPLVLHHASQRGDARRLQPE